MDKGYGPTTYGEKVADVYDRWYGDGHPFLGPVGVTVSFLRELAGPGPALELGIGTGRIALPLREAGVVVHGIDASEAMVAKLRAKPGGERIEVTLGDFRDFDLDARFRLVYVVFNTFFALLTQDDQVACFRAVARHLTDDGAFVMEAFVPDHARFDRGQRVSAVRVEPDEVSLEVTQHDPKEQTSDTQLVVIREDAIRLFPIRIRFATAPELDLMAQLAGLRLRERWGDWDRSPFTASNGKHISVWEQRR
jgi:SAM-dependent methyltransferase